MERCLLSRDSNAITVTNEQGVLHIPAASIAALLLGPGSKVTHHAMMLIAQSGAVVVWVGEQGVRYYGHGTGLATSTRLLQAQAELVSHRDKRLAVARRMYEMRFPDEVVTSATMQQLRGREGARVRQLYRRNSERTEVPWRRRDYDPDAFAEGDAINQALSAAHSSLYGVVHSLIVALGCSPGLGFVHTGHHRAFVYDIADLYKAEVTIPIAFDVVATDTPDIPGDTRRAVRDAMKSGKVIERCIADIRALLLGAAAETEPDWDFVQLWDEQLGEVQGGVSYGEDPPF
nr:type I-E CRISPR-associated endonuclease Cas1e [Granulicoccus phenolivorans]